MLNFINKIGLIVAIAIFATAFVHFGVLALLMGEYVASGFMFVAWGLCIKSFSQMDSRNFVESET